MREDMIQNIGQVLRALQIHRLQKWSEPRFGIRVTFTHHILQQHQDHFAGLVRYLAESRQAVTPGHFFKIFKKEALLDRRFFLMTFDDGLMSSYWAAKNILSHYNIKAIFFVPTQILDLKSEGEMKSFAAKNIHFGQRLEESFAPEEYLFMGKKEILDLDKEGHAVFPHTHSHCRIMNIQDVNDVERELVMPKRILENLLQKEMTAFAFPVGTERVVSPFAFPYIQKKYQFCFSGLAGINTLDTDHYFLYRDCVHGHYPLTHVRNMAEGTFDLYYRYKMAKLKSAMMRSRRV